MTAITLNLLAEEQQAQEERAHDPIKLFIAIGLGVLVVLVAWGGALSIILPQKRAELRGFEARLKKIDTAHEQEAAFQTDRAIAEEIMALNHSRVLMAPQLAMVKDLIPPTVQLSQLSFSQVGEMRVDTGGAKAVAQAPRPKLFEHLVLQLEGMACSSRPELEVDLFLRTLRNDARFSAVIEDIQLRSISRVSVGTDKNSRTSPAANFVIECRYKEEKPK